MRDNKRLSPSDSHITEGKVSLSCQNKPQWEWSSGLIKEPPRTGKDPKCLHIRTPHILQRRNKTQEREKMKSSEQRGKKTKTEKEELSISHSIQRKVGLVTRENSITGQKKKGKNEEKTTNNKQQTELHVYWLFLWSPRLRCPATKTTRDRGAHPLLSSLIAAQQCTVSSRTRFSTRHLDFESRLGSENKTKSKWILIEIWGWTHYTFVNTLSPPWRKREIQTRNTQNSGLRVLRLRGLPSFHLLTLKQTIFVGFFLSDQNKRLFDQLRAYFALMRIIMPYANVSSSHVLLIKVRSFSVGWGFAFTLIIMSWRDLVEERPNCRNSGTRNEIRMNTRWRKQDPEKYRQKSR